MAGQPHIGDRDRVPDRHADHVVERQLAGLLLGMVRAAAVQRRQRAAAVRARTPAPALSRPGRRRCSAEGDASRWLSSGACRVRCGRGPVVNRRVRLPGCWRCSRTRAPRSRCFSSSSKRCWHRWWLPARLGVSHRVTPTNPEAPAAVARGRRAAPVVRGALQPGLRGDAGARSP